ncbi:MAG: hypothetical protein ACK4TA_15840 [Saprospiraceae bacterium]
MKIQFLHKWKQCQTLFVALGMSLLLANCTTTKPLDFSRADAVNATVTRTDLLNVYQYGLKADSVNYVYAEASAAMKMGDQILLAIDKPVPGNFSPVFTVPVADVLKKPEYSNRINFVSAAPFKQALKLEAFAKAPNDSLFFATTAFDRVRGSSADWDGYNALLSWQSKNYADVQYVAASERNGVTSSRDLRSAFQKVLTTSQFPNGVPYFKIEALTVLPGNRLVFGVREIGESYLKFEYTFILVEATFSISSGGVQINPNFKKIYEYKPVVNGHQMGISDLLYHTASNSLLALSSYEAGTDEKNKTFSSSLWILPLSRLEKGEAPLPVMSEGKQLEMPYKGEGMTLLDDRTLFVIFDEDRKDTQVKIGKEMVAKQPHQAIFSIIKLR